MTVAHELDHTCSCCQSCLTWWTSTVSCLFICVLACVTTSSCCSCACSAACSTLDRSAVSLRCWCSCCSALSCRPRGELATSELRAGGVSLWTLLTGRTSRQLRSTQTQTDSFVIIHAFMVAMNLLRRKRALLPKVHLLAYGFCSSASPCRRGRLRDGFPAARHWCLVTNCPCPFESQAFICAPPARPC